MTEYIVSIAICTIAAAFLCAAAPDNNGIGKFVSFAASLVVCAVIVLPFTDGSFSEFDLDSMFSSPSAEESSGDYRDIAAQSLAMSVANSVGDKFTVSRVDITLADNETFTVEKVTVIIEPSTVDVAATEIMLSELYKCSISIETERADGEIK